MEIDRRSRAITAMGLSQMKSPVTIVSVLVLNITVSGACVRSYIEPDALVSAKVRFRLVNENEFGVVQVFKNEQCDGGRFLGLLRDINEAGPADAAHIKKQGTRDMIGSDVAAVRRGLAFETNVNGSIVIAFKWHSYNLVSKTWCPLTIAANFRTRHQYEVKFDVDRYGKRCRVVVSEVSAHGDLVPFVDVKQVDECTQVF